MWPEGSGRGQGARCCCPLLAVFRIFQADTKKRTGWKGTLLPFHSPSRQGTHWLGGSYWGRRSGCTQEGGPACKEGAGSREDNRRKESREKGLTSLPGRIAVTTPSIHLVVTGHGEYSHTLTTTSTPGDPRRQGMADKEEGGPRGLCPSPALTQHKAGPSSSGALMGTSNRCF